MPNSRPIRDRIWDLTVPEPMSGCWLWLGQFQKNGYGRIQRGPHGAGYVIAHRASYEAFIGSIPKGLVIDHLCRNKACVNPRHLEAVTQSINVRRGTNWKLHCPANHPYSGSNLLIVRGHKRCRICVLARQRRGYHRRMCERRAQRAVELEATA